MVQRTLRQRIHGVIGLDMLIYGNTPRDIGKILKANKWKLMAIMFSLVIMTLIVDKINQPQVELEALDKFWETLGSGEIQQ